MLKKHIASIRLRKNGRSEKDAIELLEEVCKALHDELLETGAVTLPNLGKIKVVEKRSRSVVNNLTNVKYCLGKRKKCIFKASEALNRSVYGS